MRKFSLYKNEFLLSAIEMIRVEQKKKRTSKSGSGKYMIIFYVGDGDRVSRGLSVVPRRFLD